MLLKVNRCGVSLENSLSERNFNLDISDFLIDSGETIGIMGQSGAGKTTFARFLTGLIKTDRGNIEIFDDRVSIGMTFQYPENQFYLNTIYDDIIIGLIEKGISENDAREFANSALERVNLNPDEYANKNHQHLSAGEKRRAAIATLLCNEYDIFIFDEPSAGLDGKEIDNLIGIFHKLKQEGKTLLIISQNSEFISQTCERLVVLDDGRIEYDGSLSKFFFNDELAKSFGLEIPPLIKTQLYLNRHFDFNFENVIKVDELKTILDNSISVTISDSLT